MKNLNLFESTVSGMDREWIENESGLTRHHGKLWKHVAMIVAVLVLSVANVGTAWGTSGVITAASTTDLGKGNTPRYVVEQAGVGRLMKNSTGSSSWTVASGKLQTGSKLFALQTYNEISSIVINGYGTGSGRTFSSMKVGAATNSYAVVSATGSGTMSDTESSQTITITPASNIAANSYVEITLSGNIYIYSVELVYAGASTKRIYMKAGAWNTDSPYFYAHSWGSSNSDVLMTLAGCETDVFYADIPSGNTSVLFTRQSTNSGIKYKNETGNWNQSADITISTNNKFTFSAWDNGSGYSTFTGGTYSAPTYTISFNGNGSTSGSTSSHTGIACDGSQTLRANGFTRTGWTFTGWNTDKYGKGTAYAEGATVSAITSNITLYAQWEKEIYLKMGSGWADANAWFAIYYYDSGADSNNGWVKMNLAESCSDPAVYKATVPGNGYNTIIFVRKNPADMTLPSWSNKWNQTSNQSLPTSNNQFTITSGSGDSYTGSWGTYSAPTYTISYAANSGSGSMSSQTGIACGTDKATTANAFTRDGYSFTGWHADVDVTVGGANKTAGTLLADKVTIQDISSNITLTAQWEEAATCSGDPTALVSGTLYQVSDMASACLGEITGTGQYFYGLSSNGKFYINGTTNSNNASTGTVEIKTASNTIDKIEFTGIAWFKDAGTNTCRSIKFVVPSAGTLTIYGKTSSSGGNVVIKTESSGNTTVIAKSVNAYASGSTTVSAGTYYVLSDGASAAIVGLKFVEESCSATQPGTISKGTLSACTLRLTAGDSPASNNTWYWQSSADGTDKTESGATKDVTSTGTYYIRSYCTTGSGCWSDARSVTVSASDLTPAAPTGLTAASTTAKGTTFTVADAANTNNYDFYVSTSSTAPVAGTGATYTETSKTLTITDKYAGTTFYAWARAKCGSNKSAWTALTGSTFTTSTVSAAYHLANVSKTSGAESGIGGSTFTAVFSANTDYSMPTPVVTIGGNAATSGTDYTWTEGTGTLTIAKEKITGNIDITLNSVPSAPSSAVISGAYHYFPGENISLTVTPTGNNGPTTYQWYKGGKANENAIDGATSATFTKNICAFEDAGSYYCKVTCNATSIWANTNSYENYDVKILRLYVNGSKSGEPYGNVDFTKVDGTTATASIALGSGWTYGFNIADGCGHYYGNAGTMQENNCTNWTTNVNGTDCGLTTTNAATYIFTINYSSLEAIVTSVTFPVANQAAGKVIYFDNNVLKWTGSSIYYRIGHSSHTQADQLSLVPGTANLYKMTTREYNGFSGWHIANATGDVGSGKSIYKTVDGTPITEATAHEGGAVTQEAITITPTTSKGYGADVGVNDNCEFYNYSLTTGMKTQNVAISPYSNGTITVNYTNTSGSAATLTSGNADLAHSVILTSITAVPAEGYEIDDPLTINGDAYVANYVVTGNTTIAASFKLKTYTISYNKGTNGTGSKASETKTHGVNFTLPGSTFTYGGHAQDGWSTSDGGALAYALSGNYTTNAAQEFFPHWKCNTPSITDNGDNTVSITVPSGTTVRYTTDGTDPSSSTGTVYSTTFSIAADCTVKAIAFQSNCTNSEIASQACDYTAPANFQMIANSSAGSDATLANNESISQGSKNCATLTGGTAVYSNADGDSKSMKVKKPNNSGQQYGWYFDATKDVITITMSAHIIKAGSIISVTGYAASNNGVYINEYDYFKNGGAEGNFTTNYTVLSTDANLLGTNVLTLSKNGSTKLYSITISNCQSATPCTTPTLPSLSNQAGCSYSAWNATPSNASAITSAGESISYSWKKGATEKATTASYTPDADGTDYTVTATVSKAGKISTSVTSSALTATKYTATSISTQPTTSVDAIEGENFTLGTGMVAVGQGTKTYQWYSYTSSGGAGEASIGSATSATYTTSKDAAGTYYYKVKVTADCGTATSNMITVTVSEPPCFKFSCSSQSDKIGAISSGGSITASLWDDATLTGGTMTNSSSESLNVNKTYGLVMESGKEVTVTLAAGSSLEVGSVIKLSAGVSDASGSQTSGLAINGNACTPSSYTSSTAGAPFTQTYTVTALDGLAGTNTFTVTMKSDLTKTYLNGITVTGCADCTPIDPELSYSKTTIWMDDADLTATPSLDKDVSTGTVSYALTSATPSGCVTLNTTTGVVTAVKRGTATITATIEADGTHCGKSVSSVITVKDMTCGKTLYAVDSLYYESSTRKASVVNATNLMSGLSGSSVPFKLNSKPSWFGLRMATNFQVGDSVVFKIQTGDINYSGESASKVAVKIFLDRGATGLYEVTGATKSKDTLISMTVTQAMIAAGLTDSLLIYRSKDDASPRYSQNHKVYWVKVYRYTCPDIFIYDDAAGTSEWSDANNWLGAAGHGSGLPTSEDRIFINKSVTVDTETASAAEMTVTNGSMVTVEKSITVGDVNIETGSTLNVAKDGESGITVATNSLYLKGGWNSSYTSYDMPRIYIDPASTLTKVVNTVNFDISVDSRNYYPIAVPFRVKVSDVDYANSTLASFSNYGANGQYVIKDYDGARRAENGPDQVNNWKVVPQKDEKNNDVYLEPGRGYIMTAISIPSYGGGVIRFPMSFTNDWTAEGEQGTIDDSYYKNVVAVTAYEGTATAGDKKVNKGWNLLGVPFMSCYGTGSDMTTGEGAASIIQGKFNFNDGNWKEDGVRYVNVPLHDFSEYIQTDITDAGSVLRPGWCFFIQIGTTGNLTFLTTRQAEESSLPIYAPKRGMKADMPTVETGIILSDGEKSDKTTFLVSDKYNGAEYEINADLEKMFGNGYTLATYSLSGTTRLAYNALGNADAANIIPIGYRAPADGEYTFSINPRYAENGAFESVNLIDYETGIVTDLLKFSYTFSTERTQNDTRFALNVVKQKETPTDIELVGGDAQVDGPRKLLLDGKMYIILDGKMFDAQGKRVK